MCQVPGELQRNCLNFFFLFLALVAIFSAEQNGLSNFGRGPPPPPPPPHTHTHTQRTILSSFVKICPVVMEEMLFEVFFFLFLALAATLCCAVEQFQQSYQFWLRSVQGVQRRCHLKFVFFCFQLWWPFCAASGTIWAILLEELQRNNLINFEWNPPSSYGDVIWSKLWTMHDRWQNRAITIAHPEHIALWRAKNWHLMWIISLALYSLKNNNQQDLACYSSEWSFMD